MDIIQWNASELADSRRNQPLAIVGTGPSYDKLDRGELRGFELFALNGAITELWPRGAWWVCHDLGRLTTRYGFADHIVRYRKRKVISRRVFLPGEFGDIPWRSSAGRVDTPYEWRLPPADLSATDTYVWYSDLVDEPGGLLQEQTVLETALEVATYWGYRPIVLIGIDMGWQGPRGYAAPWAWRRCICKPKKFEKMQRVLIEHRARWPAWIWTTSPYWRGRFQPCDNPQDILSEARRSAGIAPGIDAEAPARG